MIKVCEDFTISLNDPFNLLKISCKFYDTVGNWRDESNSVA